MRSSIKMFVLALLYTIANKGLILATESEQRTYIVHVDKSVMPMIFNNHIKWYDSTLKSVSESANLLYTYNQVVHGFSTRLTPKEAKSLGHQFGVIAVHEEKTYKLHTTRTPLFLGLDKAEKMLPDLKAVSNVIIGVLDSGIWPESKSFNDSGLGPVPSRWKGACQEGTNFTITNCNRKLIGATFFVKGYEAKFGPINESEEYRSARDDMGHGTHISSIAAGRIVNDISLFGYASGSARGMATNARVAVYKVCWIRTCEESDVVAGMERAIQDGVDILSISLGNKKPWPYETDGVAIGAFTAMTKGIFVSLAAGNYGPYSNTLSNFVPWATIVGAGTMDRDFPAYVTLGNGKKHLGISLHSEKPPPRSFVPIVYAGDVSNNATLGQSCDLAFTPEKVAGKIVICDGFPWGKREDMVRDAGGVGVIFRNLPPFGEQLSVISDLHIPTVFVGEKAGNAILDYTRSSKNPSASFLWGATRVNVQPSPKVSASSSRGPHPFTPGLLKPDILAPGLNILGAWTKRLGPSLVLEDTRKVEYNIISGTSMSCPHISGVAALIKAANPSWSPAFIRSAIMTTAYNKYGNGKPLETNDDLAKIATPFDYGAGHVNPPLALNPGLVYGNDVEDYLSFLCAANYTSKTIKLITKRDYQCEPGKVYSIGDFNYPTFSVPFITESKRGITTVWRYSRTLTNVGKPNTYKVSVILETNSLEVIIDPQELNFTAIYERKSYTVTFAGTAKPSEKTSSGQLVWSDGIHNVSSIIVFY